MPVQTLLISDNLFRINNVRKRREYATLVEEVCLFTYLATLLSTTVLTIAIVVLVFVFGWTLVLGNIAVG